VRPSSEAGLVNAARRLAHDVQPRQEL
jgi:hypothetical protein